MKLLLMPKEPTWWIWLLTVLLLVIGLAGNPSGFIAAIVLTVGQSVFFWLHYRSPRAFPVQIRLGYTALLLLCFLPWMRWLYWLPTVGTTALLLFGYCLMARMLSLLPWNRKETLSFDLLRRTFFTPPVFGNARHGLPSADKNAGVCMLEARAAYRESA